MIFRTEATVLLPEFMHHLELDSLSYLPTILPFKLLTKAYLAERCSVWLCFIKIFVLCVVSLAKQNVGLVYKFWKYRRKFSENSLYKGTFPLVQKKKQNSLTSDTIIKQKRGAWIRIDAGNSSCNTFRNVDFEIAELLMCFFSCFFFFFERLNIS